MKLRICCVLALVFMLAFSACAAGMTDGKYTDVTSVMTQDAVLNLEVFTENPELEPEIILQQPDVKSMALLESVYDFVWRQQNRPVRYYDEETQQKIQDLVPGVDIDILHLTEFMAQEMTGVPSDAVVVERLLDVDYRVGQLVVVILGYEGEDGEYVWFPYRAEVPETGLIRYVIPKEDYDILSGKPQVIYHVLTDRIGGRGESLVHSEIITVPKQSPSKTVSDLTSIRLWYTESGETIDDLFRLFVVEKTGPMQREIDRIGAFLAEELPEGEQNSIIGWFPAEIASQAQLLLPEADLEELICYDITAVMSEEYKDTYGDVATESLFASAYSSDRKMVVMLGFPLDAQELPDLPAEELEKVTHFEWYCLRAEAVEDIVEIVFKQLVIPRMETEPAMIMVLSQPIDA